MAIYVSSDWHGCSVSKIKDLLQKVSFGPEDYLFVLGDIIDRGEYGIDLLKYIMYEPNIELIRGNHESMMLSCSFLFDEITEDSIEAFDSEKLSLLRQWQSNGAEPTISALTRENIETRCAILEYLFDTPLYDTVSVNGKDYFLVHAGLGNPRGNVLPKLVDIPEEDFIWTRIYKTTIYSNDFITIVGHTPTCTYSNKYANRILKTDTWWDIDTGTTRGYSPMLLCLDTLKEYYIEEDGTVIER